MWAKEKRAHSKGYGEEKDFTNALHAGYITIPNIDKKASKQPSPIKARYANRPDFRFSKIRS